METLSGKFYEVGVKFDKTMEDGRIKKVTESYAVDGLTFSEGEKNTIDEMAQYISGEFEVVKMRPLRIEEIVRDGESSCRFWKAKIMYSFVDEKTGKEKKHPSYQIIEGADFKSAFSLLEEKMKDVIADWSLVGLTETSIFDVFVYTKSAENGYN